MKHFLTSSFALLFIIQISLAQTSTNDEIYFKIKDSIFARTIHIVEYDTINHTINFSLEKRLAFEGLKIPVSGLPFAFYVNREKIYGGMIFTSLSSGNYGGMVITKTNPDSALPPLQIQLGYPSDKFFTGQDNRNDKRLIDVLVKHKINLN